VCRVEGQWLATLLFGQTTHSQSLDQLDEFVCQFRTDAPCCYHNTSVEAFSENSIPAINLKHGIVMVILAKQLVG